MLDSGINSRGTLDVSHTCVKGSTEFANYPTPNITAQESLRKNEAMRTGTPREPRAVTSSLNSIHISPRTPRTPRATMGEDEDEETEMSLLNEEERIQSARTFHDGHSTDEVDGDLSKRPISAKDKRGMIFFKEYQLKWGVPHLTLSGYLRFWSVICFIVTLWLIFFKKEDKEPATDSDMSIKAVYKTIWQICQLKHIQLLIVVHLFAKIGFAANDAATGLKLVEKGFRREDLALVVLIDFPFQIMGGWLAAKWSRGDKPLRPWIYAFWPRLFFALVATLIVLWFPNPPISMSFFVLLVLHTILSSFASTVQFVGISAFHTRVSDPLIGGTYMTLLNTFTNMGGTWPKWFVLKGIDIFSVATCKVPQVEIDVKATECVSDHGKAACKGIGGTCVEETDGYYMVSAICLLFGVIFLVAFIIPTARKLQKLPISVWRVKMQ
ncbi:putative membrane protein [Psilocybe cubensis]|uniref:Membrane protein n=1 Tax=Psilocybe cubensis TaxID=181762 RepID=A0ACB8HFQ0_PSICU|nr:putative membrane protein [Psilocybe cubensis]KAH9486676.1 putative membrane protein [Psilocybe cubensis]